MKHSNKHTLTHNDGSLHLVFSWRLSVCFCRPVVFYLSCRESACVRLFGRVDVCVYVNVCQCVYLCVCVFVCVYVCVSVCMHVGQCVYLCVYVCMYMCVLFVIDNVAIGSSTLCLSVCATDSILAHIRVSGVRLRGFTFFYQNPLSLVMHWGRIPMTTKEHTL